MFKRLYNYCILLFDYWDGGVYAVINSEWETVTLFVQRDRRSGVIVRMQEEPPYEFRVEELKQRREAIKAVRERIKKREIGD